MKTTLVLPDDLLMEAKALAVRRKTTLKALIENALHREIRPAPDLENPDPARFEVGPFGILRIRKVPGSPPHDASNSWTTQWLCIYRGGISRTTRTQASAMIW